ncbi:hypothetical protein BDZ45DRAFT_725267 [Acephala macrosclerotiorum]|nr:hypothetical protein BDZ45DRAFT_725267 [Acephala macrosclerotiorum]
MAEIGAQCACVLDCAIRGLFDKDSKTSLDDFATSVGEVPRAFRHIKTELPLITDSLRRVQNQAKSGMVDSVTIEAVDAVIKDCQQEVSRLEIIFDTTVPAVGDSSWNRRKKAFLSLGKDKNVEEIAESLGRYVQALTLHQAVAGSKPDPRLYPQLQPQTIKQQYFALIPFDRNSNFIERKDVFKQIDDSFKTKEGGQPKAALFGLGGIGKSQIALEYCFRRIENDPECSVFWVHAATSARFEESYKRIATGCSLVAREDTQVDFTQLVQNWLESRYEGRWLIVVDNVDDADVFFREATSNKKTLSQYIPRTGKGSLLFTTRSRDIAFDLILPATPIPVPVLTKSEGGRLLRSRVTGKHSEEHIVELLEELEYLPLAVTQAAAFMSKRQKTIPKYLELYRKSDSARVRMLSYEFSDHGRQYNSMESVAKTWIISFEYVRRENPRSADLLSLMSYFDRHAIPSSLVHSEEEDVLDFEEAVAMLCAFSFIESDEAGTSFDMHNLVQLATKLWLIDEKEGEEDQWAFEALKSLAQKFPARQNHPTPEYWTLCASFLPHAQLILAHPFRFQREETQLARATLLFSVARYVHWRDAWMESESTRKKQESVDAGRRCLELRREMLGEDHVETIDCVSDLAGALELQGQFEMSEEMQRQALQASERILGPEHPDTMNCLSGLAAVLDSRGKYEEAEIAYREVIRLKTKVLGQEISSMLIDLHNLAVVLRNQDKDDEAEEVFRRVLELEQKMFGKSHVGTILTLASLVALLSERGKWHDIAKLSGWFLGEPDVAQPDENPMLQWAVATLKRFSFYGLGSAYSSEYGDSGISDDQSEWKDVVGNDGVENNVQEDDAKKDYYHILVRETCR